MIEEEKKRGDYLCWIAASIVSHINTHTHTHTHTYTSRRITTNPKQCLRTGGMVLLP